MNQAAAAQNLQTGVRRLSAETEAQSHPADNTVTNPTCAHYSFSFF